MIQSVRRS